MSQIEGRAKIERSLMGALRRVYARGDVKLFLEMAAFGKKILTTIR
jgi:hypothetical protein